MPSRRRTPPHPDRVTMLGAGSARGKDFSALRPSDSTPAPKIAVEAFSARFEGVQRIVLEDFPDPKIARALSPNGRAHWTVKKQARDAVIQAVVLATIGAGLHAAHGPVRITYRWVTPVQRKRDLDNHGTGVVKVVQDCLVRLGLIDADDSSCVVGITTEIVYERGRRALEIEIREV